MFTNGFLGERESWAEQVRENSARTALAWGRAHTTGWGEVRIGDPIMFDCTFTELPTVSYGYDVDDDERLEEGWYPRASGGVYRWLRDDNDYYVGAHVFVTVDAGMEMMTRFVQDFLTRAVNGDASEVNPLADAPEYDLTHHFFFVGMARKDG